MNPRPNATNSNADKGGIPPLHKLYFYLTEGCNLKCRHCWLAPKFDAHGDRYPTLPVELFEAAIIEAGSLGLRSVKLTGGEPLLHPHIDRLLEIVRSKELELTIETNGLLLTPGMAKEIAKSASRFVSVSIDGADAATHDWVRGLPGSFKRARQAVRHMAAVDTQVQIIMSLMRCNADQVDAVVRIAENLGASSVKFNIVQPSGRGERMNNGTDGLSVAELISLGRHVEMELANNTKLSLYFDYPPAFVPLSRLAKGDGCGICGILNILGVIATGQYALCGIGKHVSDLVFGTVGADRLKEVWEKSTVLQSLRIGMPDNLTGVCARCLMKHICLGQCIAQNYYRSKNLWAPFWFCAQAEKTGLFPESRLGLKGQRLAQFSHEQGKSQNVKRC
jgi:SynChlorMet cassette radical SAM/SPASM protein ScmF